MHTIHAQGYWITPASSPLFLPSQDHASLVIDCSELPLNGEKKKEKNKQARSTTRNDTPRVISTYTKAEHRSQSDKEALTSPRYKSRALGDTDKKRNSTRTGTQDERKRRLTDLTDTSRP